MLHRNDAGNRHAARSVQSKVYPLKQGNKTLARKSYRANYQPANKIIWKPSTVHHVSGDVTPRGMVLLLLNLLIIRQRVTIQRWKGRESQGLIKLPSGGCYAWYSAWLFFGKRLDYNLAEEFASEFRYRGSKIVKYSVNLCRSLSYSWSGDRENKQRSRDPRMRLPLEKLLKIDRDIFY